MFIKEITDSYSTDIYGILECEYCGATRKFAGSTAPDYKAEVVPSFYCQQCGKNRAGEVKNEN